MARIDDWSNSEYLLSVDPTSATWFTRTDGNGPAKSAINTLGLLGISISIKPVSGTLNGTFKLQVTDFGDSDAVASTYPVSADWVDYPSSTQPAAAAVISSTIQWQIWNLRSKWIRVVFTDNGSVAPRVNVAVTGRVAK